MATLEFDGRRRRDKPVVDAWTAYFDLLCDKDIPRSSGWYDGKTLLVELLHAMARALDYPHFDRVRLKRSIYYPQAMGGVGRGRAFHPQVDARAA